KPAPWIEVANDGYIWSKASFGSNEPLTVARQLPEPQVITFPANTNSNEVLALAVSPDAQRMVLARERRREIDGGFSVIGPPTLELWDLVTKTRLMNFGQSADDPRTVSLIRFAPDRRMVAVGTSQGVVFFDAQSGAKIGATELKTDDPGVTRYHL